LTEIPESDHDHSLEIGVAANPANEVKTDARLDAKAKDYRQRHWIGGAPGRGGGLQMRLSLRGTTQPFDVRRQSLNCEMLLKRARLRIVLFNQKNWT
jgi:hypothetical protein